MCLCNEKKDCWSHDAKATNRYQGTGEATLGMRGESTGDGRTGADGDTRLVMHRSVFLLGARTEREYCGFGPARLDKGNARG